MTERGPSMVLGGVQWGPERHPVLWVWEPYEEPKRHKKSRKYGEYWAFYLHRLYAYAHGIIDHPRFDTPCIAIDGHNNDEIRMEPDPREVHHIDGGKHNSMPDNLEGLSPEEHGRVTNAV